jgi:hypothetical protein
MRDTSASERALQINLDDSIYGTFAEIGAGQEVARQFFQAGKASNTIAKSISAYDMTFSDEIYGKESRYVCESRLMKMLDYEYSLVQERLRAKRGDTSRFFAFADTVATAPADDGFSKSHGWMGVRFQTRPGGPHNDIIIHVKLWDRFRLQQQEALGILGVNLMHMAFFPPDTAEERVSALLYDLNTRRVEVNMIRVSGPDLNHLDNRILSLELVKQHLTEAVLFGAGSEVLHAADALYGKPVLIQRGAFRPVTNVNLEIAAKVMNEFKELPAVKGKDPRTLFEITMNSLSGGEGGQVNDEDFLHRVDTLAAVGQEVLVSNFKLFYQMKAYLRFCTNEMIGIVIGASTLPKMLDEKFYKDLPGGMLEGMSRLFEFPHKENHACSTAGTFSPGERMDLLYKHLMRNQWITDVLNCDDVDTTLHSQTVRELMLKRDPKWKSQVPEKARKIIEERQLFGYRP